MPALVLARRPGETIDIGDDIQVTLLSIRGGVARLRIEAPREVTVNRREVTEAIERSKPEGDGA